MLKMPGHHGRVAGKRAKILPGQRVPDFRWERDVLVVDAAGVEGRFRWPRASRKSRTFGVTTRAGRREVDLLATCADGRGVWPVSRELQSFLNGGRLDARIAHELLVRVLAAR